MPATKLRTRIKIDDSSGMPEVIIAFSLDGVLFAEDTFMLYEFLDRLNLNHVVEPRRPYREIFKTQRALLEKEKNEQHLQTGS